MKIRTALFKGSAAGLDGCPEWNVPEFAMIGRSNVGKSSLINALTGKEGLAKVSATPGKTRLINFFHINDRWCLVDLPGYGYAQAAQAERQSFNQTTAEYLANRGQLAHLFVLVDSRITPQSIDLDFIAWLGAITLPFSLVLTKAEKLRPNALKAAFETFRTALIDLPRQPLEIIASSSKTGDGRRDILLRILTTIQDTPNS
jgi:GTP-binding protein